MKRSQEDYLGWSKKQQILNDIKQPKYAQIGEVWRYHIGVNIGNELGKGKQGNYCRTGIILHNSLKNGLLLVAPITTKNGWFTSLNSLKLKNYGGMDARILLDQIQLIDSRRLTDIKKFKKGRSKVYGINFVKKIVGLYHSLFSFKKNPPPLTSSRGIENST